MPAASLAPGSSWVWACVWLHVWLHVCKSIRTRGGDGSPVGQDLVFGPVFSRIALTGDRDEAYLENVEVRARSVATSA